MILVVGLGNPGEQYRNTRHNIGFMVADALVERLGGAPWRSKFSGELATLDTPSGKVLVLKPQTYMNLSGTAAQQAASFFKIPRQSVLAIFDELDLPLGRLQLKSGGGEAGHNGVRSLTQTLGGPDYLRLRVGIGRPPENFSGRGADYVLQGFAVAEQPLVTEVIGRAADAAKLVIDQGVERAMNRINQKPKPTP